MTEAASPVVVTDRAAQRIGQVLAGEPVGTKLRVSVEGGGCSGFQYRFGFDTERAADDILVENGGASVLIDETSLQFLAGSHIDFVDELMGQSFKVINPNATASCGCGTSFSV